MRSTLDHPDAAISSPTTGGDPLPHSAPPINPDPCVLVIFGASGDLASRKLIPALCELDAQGKLPDAFCVLGVSRTKMTDEAFRAHIEPSVHKHAQGLAPDTWKRFAHRLHYHAADPTTPNIYPALTKRLRELGTQFKITKPSSSNDADSQANLPNILFYLSVAPQLVVPIVDQIGAAGLIFEGKRWCAVDPDAMPWQRIIVEKPIGHDLGSAIELHRAIGRVFDEEAIYRIDHYLGKELVQNILVMRFANAIFEPTWNSKYIDHIQVTAAESVGVGRRAGNFYDHIGATRDMLQSHLLQVMALIGMEPPSEYTASAICAEKIKLMEAVRPISRERQDAQVALGRYGKSGNANDEDGGLAYLELEGVKPERNAETFSAMRLNIDNWRWSGVPFYIRSGKKLARKLTEVFIQFKRPPIDLFRHADQIITEGARPANHLIINIAPGEGVGLSFEAKVPGSTFRMGSVSADLDYQEVFDAQPSEAYGQLLLDAMRGDKTLFKHRDEVENMWRIVQPVLGSAELNARMETYDPGTWGPSTADALIAADGRQWHNPTGGSVR